ncbi:glycosyl transferase family 1 [Pedobacter psychrophilus]|uniref:Glycosyl transferase family 1 n=1 Tax=Pedobacter psychrophilus TaxID=1826909 RepID=A0A179DAL6_9SPHI|nr:glycosyltransferase [Pedobacter psychrophilus]OAQ38095.1 glycosyl transferase family 1 [Pedobacter psychrophilus]
MLENTFVFILSNAKYDAPIESTGFTVAKYLSKNNTVFYIEYPATIKDYYRLKTSPEFKKKRDLFTASSDGLLATETPNLHILITPVLLSINFIPEGSLYRKLLSYNESLIVKRIEKIKKKYKIKDFIFINSFNIHYPNIGTLLNAKLNVYHCVDPIIEDYDAKHGHLSEEIILKNADLVICTSKELYKNKLEQHPYTFFVPNAADFEHSEKANSETTEIHPNILDIKKPIIGYFGNIERRIDYRMLEKVMKLNSDKSFVFVGPIEAEYLKKIKKETPNLYLIEQVPYKLMPSVLKGFDVAIIPFKKDSVSHNIFPLKLFEYLGSGKPVISTDFNIDLDEFTNGTVPYCKTADEFSNAINDALLNDNQEKQNLRLKAAKDNTWDKRLDEFSNILQKHLEKKED